MEKSTRVILNTIVQYIRTIITTIVALYTSRIVLSSLGVDDYGIYSLVGGVIGMLSFIQNNLSAATQRFLSYHQGRKDQQMVIKVFNNSLSTQIIITSFLCIILAICTQPIFNHLLNIPTHRIHSAHIVYWLMLVSLFFNMMSAPFLAALVSRENIVYSSLIQIIDAIIKVPIVLCLTIIQDNRLEWYSVMMVSVTIFNFLCYYIYARKKYDECQHFSMSDFDFKLCKEMLSFMSWFIYSSLCIVGRTQGIAILLNNFFTTAMNTAYGIGGALAGQLYFISAAISTAFRPRIIKTEGGGERQQMFRLSEISCKFAFILISMITIPMILHMDDVLSLWLEDVPDYTATFCIGILLAHWIDALTIDMGTANAAIGNVRTYLLLISTIKILTIPITLIVLIMDGQPFHVMSVYFIVEAFCSLSRVVFLHYTVQLSLTSFFNNVISKVTLPILTNITICYFVSLYCHGILFLITCVISVIVTSSMTYLLGLKNDEKSIIDSFIKKLLK